MRRTVAEPYARLAGVEPTLLKTEAADVGENTRACVYTFEAGGQSQVPEVGQMTVTVARHQDGSQPLAICVAGAAQRGRLPPAEDRRSGVYDPDLRSVDESRRELLPRRGRAAPARFVNEVDAALALSPIILTVAEGRIPPARE